MQNIYSYTLMSSETEKWNDFMEYWDLYQKNNECYPKVIRIWYGQFMDKLQVEYDGKAMPKHGGGEPGGYTEMKLENGEYITGIALSYTSFNCSSHMINKFEIQTSKKRKLSFCGWGYEKGYTQKEFIAPDGCAIVALGGALEPFNRGGSLCVSGITAYYKKVKTQEKDEFGIREKYVNGDQVRIAELHGGIGSNVPKSDICINRIVGFGIEENCEYICATVSAKSEKLYMPAGVTTTLYAPDGSVIGAHNTDTDRVVVQNGNFYQIYREKPIKGQYKLYISCKTDAKFFFESQIIYKDAINRIEAIESELEKEIGQSDILPLFSRPLYRIDLVRNNPAEANAPTSDREIAALPEWAALHLFHTIFAGPYAYIVMVGILSVSVIIAIVVKCFKSKKDVETEIEKEIEKIRKNAEKQWAKPDVNDRTIYQFAESYEIIENITFEQQSSYEVQQSARDIWKQLYKDNKNTVAVSKMKKKLSDQKGVLRIDVGGEGCFHYSGLSCGAADALNFNGRIYNSQLGKVPIPMLVHFSDWTKEKFPVDDGIVDAFMMQGCGNPTYLQATEMVRCLKKQRGSKMEFWVMEEEELDCYKWMQCMLQKKVGNATVELKSEKDNNYSGMQKITICIKEK